MLEVTCVTGVTGARPSAGNQRLVVAPVLRSQYVVTTLTGQASGRAADSKRAGGRREGGREGAGGRAPWPLLAGNKVGDGHFDIDSRQRSANMFFVFCFLIPALGRELRAGWLASARRLLVVRADK